MALIRPRLACSVMLLLTWCFAGCCCPVSGGVFTAASAERLLRCLALACPQLEELHVLPEPTCGLGDDQVEHLLALTALKVRQLLVGISIFVAFWLLFKQ